MSINKLLLHNRDKKVLHELNLKNQDISQESRDKKLIKMSNSPYTFYRGANHLYWEDFYNDWRINFFGGSKETLTWINGDAHIYNYGAYANHDGEAIFCMDDFDDSVIADYQFDLWRMAVSIVLDCRENNVFKKKHQKKALLQFAQSYRKQMIMHTDDEVENEKHYTAKTSKGLLKKFLKKVEMKKSRIKMLDKWTDVINDQRTFNLKNTKVKSLTKTKYRALERALQSYQSTINSDLAKDKNRFKVKDIVRRLSAGTGSLGTERYYALLEGDSNEHDDDVIIDIKEQGKPPVYDHMSTEEQREFDRIFPNQAQRHALAFQALAEHPDKYLGWIDLDEKCFSIKERSPFKADFPTAKLKKPKDLFFMADIWGDVLATRHKRASYVLNDKSHELPTAFSLYVRGKEEEFDELVLSIAFQYTDCVKQDYEYLLNSINEH